MKHKSQRQSGFRPLRLQLSAHHFLRGPKYPKVKVASLKKPSFFDRMDSAGPGIPVRIPRIHPRT